MANAPQTVMPTKGLDDVDEFVEVDDGKMTVVNAGGLPMTFNIGHTKITLKPGQKTRIEKMYALPQSGINPKGDPIPSVIEMLTDGNVVAETHRKARPFFKNEEQRRAQYAGRPPSKG